MVNNLTYKSNNSVFLQFFLFKRYRIFPCKNIFLQKKTTIDILILYQKSSIFQSLAPIGAAVVSSFLLHAKHYFLASQFQN